MKIKDPYLIRTTKDNQTFYGNYHFAKGSIAGFEWYEDVNGSRVEGANRGLPSVYLPSGFKVINAYADHVPGTNCFIEREVQCLL